MKGQSILKHNVVFNISYVWALFLFSRGRRHTRLTCDWSSDVCSSDLCGPVEQPVLPIAAMVSPLLTGPIFAPTLEIALAIDSCSARSWAIKDWYLASSFLVIAINFSLSAFWVTN